MFVYCFVKPHLLVFIQVLSIINSPMMFRYALIIV